MFTLSIFLYVFSKHLLSMTVFWLDMASVKDCCSLVNKVVIVVLVVT